MRKTTYWIALSCLLVATNSNADIGLGLSLKAEATVGLNDRTIAMINGLPSEVRKQVILALEQALPLLDKSVLLYLQEVQKIINGLGPVAFCAAKGAKEGLFEPDENRASDLEERLIKARSSFDGDSKPVDYENPYSLIERDASRNLCVEFSGTNQETRINDVKMLSGNLAYMWHRLRPYCSDAYSCQIEAMRQVKALISISNQTDVKNLKSDERLTKIPTPLKPTFFKSNYDVDMTETNLSVILGINDELVAAKLARKVRYDKVYPTYSQELTKLIVDFDIAKNNLPVEKPSKINKQVQQGCVFYYKAKLKLVDIKNELKAVTDTGYLLSVYEIEEQSKVAGLQNTIDSFAKERLSVRGITIKPDACWVKLATLNGATWDAPITR